MDEIRIVGSYRLDSRVVTADMDCSRYDVALIAHPNGYIVSVVNLKVSFWTKRPWDCSYKLLELGLSKADADNIERILKEMCSDLKK